jgi:hypothetical protein
VAVLLDSVKSLCLSRLFWQQGSSGSRALLAAGLFWQQVKHSESQVLLLNCLQKKATANSAVCLEAHALSDANQ